MDLGRGRKVPSPASLMALLIVQNWWCFSFVEPEEELASTDPAQCGKSLEGGTET